MATYWTMENDQLSSAAVSAVGAVDDEHPYDLHALLRKVYHRHSERAGKHDQRFTLAIAPDLPREVIGDSAPLANALSKLTEYVLAVSAPHSVALLAERIAHSDGKAYLHFAIQNTGPEILEPLKGRILQAFTRSLTAMSELEGVPITLIETTAIVHQLRGLLWLQTSPEGGNSFDFALWLRTAAH